MKKIERLLKYASGGKVAKFLDPAGPITKDINRLSKIGKLAADYGLTNEEATELIDDDEAYDNFIADHKFSLENGFNNLEEQLDQSLEITGKNPVSEEERAATELRASNLTPTKKSSSTSKLSKMTADLGVALAANLGIQAINAVDGAVMGDKNFSASSQAIDTAVHGVSGALMKSGNPYAMAAGVALEGINFITKAGGKNVLGYDVGIENSGYGNLGHQDSEAGRIWDNWNGNTARKLAKRNLQVKMALAAADISQEQQFEQESRQTSAADVLKQNLIALAGGIDTSLLGS